ANADGTWTFRPAENFNGTVTFTYGVTDGTETVAGSASLEVTAVNDAPTTAPVTLDDVTEDGELIITPADLLQNAGDVDLDALTITGLTASNGTITANADGTWTFRPAENFNGTV
ncbi:cadherin-like domain-containing protein, partial [Streptococcus pyogenes]|uniref:cadherin-like domain-containing protein n=1 Tax=Streptococcus pyogenes TaxID=1314 RepID=UPI003D9FD2B4